MKGFDPLHMLTTAFGVFFFPYGIDVQIVASENAEWLVTFENH